MGYTNNNTTIRKGNPLVSKFVTNDHTYRVRRPRQFVCLMQDNCLTQHVLEPISGPKTELLGQLIVTPKGVASKICNMEENKSPGVYGISHKNADGNCRTHLSANRTCISHVTARGRSSFRMESSQHAQVF